MAVYISNHHLKQSGGIERYAMTLVRGLHERGIRPTFIAKSFDAGLAEYGWVDPVALRVSGVPGKLRDRWFDWRLRRAKQARGWFPLIACNQTGAADIAICGSNHPAYLAAMGDRPQISDRWKIALERAHLANARCVVVHSRALASQAVQHYGIRADKIELLYPPVDTERFAPLGQAERTAARNALGLPTDRPVFLLASTGHRRKGLALLAEHFAALQGKALLVVAGRPIDMAGPHIRYLGYRTDMENVYRSVDFTVLASRYEPFGLVGVESVACGTAVLLAKGVGCGEVIADAAKIEFSLTDEGALLRAVDQAIQRWRSGSHRLDAAATYLAYDPSIALHLDALLRVASAIERRA